MKRHTITLVAVVIAILIAGYFIYFMNGIKVSTGPFSSDSQINMPDNDTSFQNLFFSYYINDSLPYYTYTHIEDSINKIKQRKELDNKGVGSYLSFGSVGLGKVRKTWVPDKRDDVFRDSMIKLKTDSLNNILSNLPKSKGDDSLKKVKELNDINWRIRVLTSEVDKKLSERREYLYYFTLSGYTLDPENEFFVQNGKYYLAIVKWDRTIKRTYDSTMVGHYERKAIPVRYYASGERILIPISQGRYNFLNTSLRISVAVWLFLMILILLGLPIQILIDLSKGRAFTKANIKRFKIMSLVLFIYIGSKVITPYLLNFIFRKYIPAEFELHVFEGNGAGISAFIFLVLAATALFLIARAFQKGYNLQQEQDLTI